MKKIIKIFIIILLLIPITYFGIYFVQNYSLKRSFAKENQQEFDKNFKFIRCNYNFLQPNFAFVFPFRTGGFISFEKSKKFLYQSKEEWDINHIGTTTIKNTTFPELLKMVKEDCSQFQKPKGDPKDKIINWRYSPAEKPNYIQEVTDTYYEYFDSKDLFEQKYGNPHQMSEEQAKEIYFKIKKEGVDQEILDKHLQSEIDEYREGFLREYNTLTQKQKNKIIETYGEWRNLSDEELYKYGQKVSDDLFNDQFKLDDE